MNKNNTKNTKSSAEPPKEIHHHYYHKAVREKKKHSSKPTIIGSLLILTAIVGFVFGSVVLVGGIFLGELGGDDGIFGIEDNADVSGRVTYLNDTGVENVTVSIINTDLSTTTDEDGYYVIYGAPTGNQEILVEKEGYNTYLNKVFITPGSDVQWDVETNEFKNENEFDFRITKGNQTIERGEESPWGLISGFFLFCAVLVLFFSVIALIGGIFALNRKKFSFVLAGAILGIFTLVGAIFSLIALFMLMLSKDEFKRGES